MSDAPILIDVREVLPRDYRALWRRLLWESHDGRCGLCHEPVALEAMQIDHILPRVRGGEDIWTNLQPSHKPCNSAKSGDGFRRVALQPKRCERCGSSFTGIALAKYCGAECRRDSRLRLERERQRRIAAGWRYVQRGTPDQSAR